MRNCQNRSSSNGNKSYGLASLTILVLEDFCRRKLHNYLENVVVI